MKLFKNRHSVYNLNYHIVLITKYRHDCINNELFQSMKSTIKRLMESCDGCILEINHNTDHIHILLSIPPQISPSEAVRSIKSTTSRVVRRDFPEYLTKYYWKDSFWSDSYLVLTTGGATIDIIKEYISNQKKGK